MENKILKIFRECALEVEDALEDLDTTSLDKTTKMGADGTPTSELDSIVEKVAIGSLKGDSDYSIYSEEYGLLKGGEEGNIIMDPIDGTSNALTGIPFYSISLAFTPGGFSDTTVGYVKNLPLGKEYYAIKGRGSYVAHGRGDDEAPVRIPNLPANKELNFSVYMGRKAHPDSTRIASLARRTRSLGSASLEMCMVAEGPFDLYHLITINKERSLRITDIAASTLILREVGGQVYQSRWVPIDMDLDISARSDVIAIRDEKIKEVIG